MASDRSDFKRRYDNFLAKLLSTNGKDTCICCLKRLTQESGSDYLLKKYFELKRKEMCEKLRKEFLKELDSSELVEVVVEK